MSNQKSKIEDKIRQPERALAVVSVTSCSKQMNWKQINSFIVAPQNFFSNTEKAYFQD